MEPIGPVSRHSRPGWLAVALTGVAGLLAGAAVAWGLWVVLTPAEDPLVATEFTVVEVGPGSVGSSLSLNTLAGWTTEPVGVNAAAGVVTAVEVGPGEEVDQGSLLYRVNERPVVVAAGDVPAFRAIGQDAAGADVAQLQRMLAALDVYDGPDDGRAGAETVAAIERWQQQAGGTPTGTMEFGDVIFVPQLPTRVSLDPELVARGLTVSGGEPAVLGLSASPDFTVPVTEGQSTLVPEGTTVNVSTPDGGTWEAVAGERERDEQAATVVIALSGPDGETVCGEGCGQIAVTGTTTLPSLIVTVEEVSGLVVPSAALVTGADGMTAVIGEDGARQPVTVVAAARGMSVVEGAAEGTRVRVPAVEGPGG